MLEPLLNTPTEFKTLEVGTQILECPYFQSLINDRRVTLTRYDLFSPAQMIYGLAKQLMNEEIRFYEEFFTQKTRLILLMSKSRVKMLHSRAIDKFLSLANDTEFRQFLKYISENIRLGYVNENLEVVSLNAISFEDWKIQNMPRGEGI